MSNRYFDPEGLEVIDGSIAQSKHVNSVTDETDAAFDLVQGELDQAQGIAELAYSWANNDQGDEPKPIENPGEYSAKANAQESKSWASGTGGVDTEADGVTTIPYSAAEKAAEASASEIAAGISETNAAASEAKAEQWATYTGGPVPGEIEYSSKYYAQSSSGFADAAQASALSASTSEGNASNSAAAALNSENAAALSETNAGNSAAAALVSENAAALSETNAGTSETNASNSAAAALSSENAAALSETNALASENKAEKWAEEAEDVEVETGAYSSYHWAQKAEEAAASITPELFVSQDSETGAADIPTGTTAQRPVAPSTGYFRYNTDEGANEVYDGAEWVPVAGGGGGGLTEGLGNGNNKIENGDFASDTIWTKGTGWAIGSGVATKTAGTASNLDHTFVPVASEDYVVTFTITALTADGFTPNLGGFAGTKRTATGIYSETITTTNTNTLKFAASDTAAGSIDDVVVQRVSELNAVTAVTGEWYPIDTSIPMNTVTVTMPTAPEDGDKVGIKDVANSFDHWECAVDFGDVDVENVGSGIMNLTVRGQYVEFVYSAVSEKWFVVNSTPMGARDVYNKPFMRVKRIESSGTDGGSFAVGINELSINSVDANDIPGASFGSGAVTLPAGEYWIESKQSMRKDSTAATICLLRLYLYDSSDNTLLVGQNHLMHNSYEGSTAIMSGKVILSQPTTVRPVLYSNRASATYGLGRALTQGDELYHILDIWKLDTEIKSVSVADPEMYLKKPLLHVEDRKALNTGGGATTAATTHTRALNTIVTNEISGASLSSNVVTLPAGTYWIEGDAPACHANVHKAWLANNDTSAVLLDGQTQNSPQQVYVHGQAPSSFRGRVTLTETTNVSVKHYITSSYANGFGLAMNQGDHEVYTTLRIWREDALMEDSVISVPNPDKWLSQPLMHVQDQKTQGSNGQTLTSNGFTVLNLNTVLTNEITGASLGSDTITLPAGEYYVEAASGWRHVNPVAGNSIHRLDLYVDSSSVLSGHNSGRYCATNGHACATVTLSGRLNLSSSGAIQLKHASTVAGGTDIRTGNTVGRGTEVYTDIRIWRLDAVVQQPIVKSPANVAVTNAYVTGGIYGGELEYLSASTVKVKAYSCMSDDLASAIAKDSDTTVDLGTTAINTIYHIFAVKYTGATYGCEFDTDVDGANLTGITDQRWLGFVLTDSSGNIKRFQQTGNLITFTDRDQMIFFNSWVNTGFNQIDHSSFIPVTRIDEIAYGYFRNAGSGSNYACDTSLDGVNQETFIGYCASTTIDPATSINAWGVVTSDLGSVIPFTNSRYFRSGAATGSFSLLIKALRIKR